MRSRWNLPFCCAYAACALALLFYLAFQMGGRFWVQPSYHITAVFATAVDLVPGDDVTISGVTVGQVASVAPSAQGAQVGLEIQEEHAPVYRDARAMIKVKNLLGETYVELERGTPGSGPLAQGGTIPSSQTLTPVEIDQVLDVLDQSTRAELVSLIDNLGESVSGQGPDINSETASLEQVATSLEQVAAALAREEGEMGPLLTDLNKVLQTLAAWNVQLGQLIQHWDGVMRALAAHEQSLQGLIQNEEQVMAVLDAALSRNAPGLGRALAQSPALLESANAYTANSDVIFGQVSQHTDSISQLFRELASVMSATDSQGNHEWRIYPVSGGLGTISQPLLGGAGG